MDNTFLDKEPAIFEIFRAFSLTIAISVFIYAFLVTPNQISGDSMSPNLSTNDLVLTNRVSQWLGGTDLGRLMDYDYKRGDIVVFQKQNQPDYIKRIVAVAGDKISLSDGKLLLNGQVTSERYILPSARTYGGTFLAEGDVKIVPEGSYFLLGDNRTVSQDSRFNEIGFVNRSEIIGKVFVKYWPLNEFNLL